VQVRRSLDKAEFYGPAFSLGYSAAVTAGIIKSISEENTLDTEAVVALFANELKDRTVRSIKGDAANSAEGGGSSPQRQASGKFRSGSNAVLPTLSEDEDSQGIANNPLHAKQGDGQTQANGHSVDKPSTSTGGAQDTGRPPISPVFTSPFTNAISNAQPQPSSGQEPPLSRTVTNNSEYTPSEASFHTADSFPTPAPSTSLPSPSAAAAIAPSGTSHSAGANTAPAPPPPSAAPRLLSLSEGMPEYYVQCAVQTLIFDTNTSEGNTRKIFIDKFKSACIVSLAQNALTSAAARGHMQAGYTGGGCSWFCPRCSVYVGLLVIWRACDDAHWRARQQQQCECAQERQGRPGRHAAGGAALHRRHARVHPQQPRGVAGPAVRAGEAARHDPADSQRR
jgi:hypothetical protein